MNRERCVMYNGRGGAEVIYETFEYKKGEHDIYIV